MNQLIYVNNLLPEDTVSRVICWIISLCYQPGDTVCNLSWRGLKNAPFALTKTYRGSSAVRHRWRKLPRRRAKNNKPKAEENKAEFMWLHPLTVPSKKKKTGLYFHYVMCYECVWLCSFCQHYLFIFHSTSFHITGCLCVCCLNTLMKVKHMSVTLTVNKSLHFKHGKSVCVYPFPHGSVWLHKCDQSQKTKVT